MTTVEEKLTLEYKIKEVEKTLLDLKEKNISLLEIYETLYNCSIGFPVEDMFRAIVNCMAESIIHYNDIVEEDKKVRYVNG